MKGNPKFEIGDKVSFTFLENEPPKIGNIYIVDKYGTFEDPNDVSYDILVKEENMLYKHIAEKYVINKVD